MLDKEKIGIWNVISDSFIVSQITSSYDFIILDLEHGFRDYKDIESQVKLVQRSAAKLFVRVRRYDDPLIQSLLDLGVSNFLIPQIRTLGEVENFSRQVHFPPAGTRGYHPKIRHLEDSQPRSNDSIYSDRIEIYPLIETRESVEILASILELDYVSGCYIGTFDLSTELSPGNMHSSEIENVIKLVAEASRKNEKTVFFMPRHQEDFSLVRTMGFNHIVLGIDSEIIANALSELKFTQ